MIWIWTLLLMHGWASADSLQLTSKAFQALSEIPSKYTCEGANISPPLEIKNIPKNAKSLVLIVDDPDAPDPGSPKMIWVHWVLYNWPVSVTKIEEGISELPSGAKVGRNDWNRSKYSGPCPPIGLHRYFFKLYALDTALNLENPDKKQVETAMTGHVLARTTVIGTYKKKRLK